MNKISKIFIGKNIRVNISIHFNNKGDLLYGGFLFLLIIENLLYYCVKKNNCFTTKLMNVYFRMFLMQTSRIQINLLITNNKSIN